MYIPALVLEGKYCVGGQLLDFTYAWIQIKKSHQVDGLLPGPIVYSNSLICTKTGIHDTLGTSVLCMHPL